MKRNIEKALRIALTAHEGQTDKAGMPYILHPMKVASNQKTPEGIIVALLHDVVEDTDITIEDLAKEFPENITEAIQLLTHKDGMDYLDYIRIIKSNELAKEVKIQDLLHNSDLSRLERITEKDKKRVQKYEKALSILIDED